MLGVLNSVERYNVVTNQWEQIDPMSTNRWLHGMVAVSDRLIVAGGCDARLTPYSTVECFM